ncbi:MAG: copper chaperone PCu(A)C, partial [Pseudomonadota bacterium]
LLVPASVAVSGLAPAAITLHDAWTRPAAAGMNAAGYGAITNRGPHADRLIGAASAAASKVSIHESRSAGGVMSMRTLSDLAIPAGATVTFAPGGLHLMLEGLKRPLNPGARVAITLTFIKAGVVRSELVVRNGDPAPPMPGMRP